MSTFLGLLLNQKKKEENRSIHNREITYVWVWFSNKDLNIKKITILK